MTAELAATPGRWYINAARELLYRVRAVDETFARISAFEIWSWNPEAAESDDGLGTAWGDFGAEPLFQLRVAWDGATLWDWADRGHLEDIDPRTIAEAALTAHDLVERAYRQHLARSGKTPYEPALPLTAVADYGITILPTIANIQVLPFTDEEWQTRSPHAELALQPFQPHTLEER